MLRPPPGDTGVILDDHRDAYGEWAWMSRSEHFIVKWQGAPFTEFWALQLLDALEASWTVLVDELGHPDPRGGDPRLFNVYIAGEEGGPGEIGSAGYFTYDPEGWPMVVMEPLTFNELGVADLTAAHELYHAIQDVSAAFPYDDVAGWFWEASAEWASTEVYPNSQYSASFLHAYAFRPYLPVNFFDYPDTGELQELYQYGAFIFPTHLSLALDGTVIRDVWTRPSDPTDPLASLASMVAERGGSLEALWLDHVAATATWDYPNGDHYQTMVDWAATFLPDDDHRSLALPIAGTAAPTAPPAEQRPGRYGANLWHSPVPRASTVRVRVDGSAVGSMGSPARFGARVVYDRVGEPAVFAVPFDGTNGELLIDEPLDGNGLWIAVGAWTDTLDRDRWQQERFDYTIELEITHVLPTGPTPEPEAPRACACDGGAVGWWWLPVLMWRRRER